MRQNNFHVRKGIMTQKITKEQYLQDPCGSLSTAYWKHIEYAVPENIKIIHERDCPSYHNPETKKYFRLFHDLKEIAAQKSDEYFFQNVNIETEKALVARMLSDCYNTEYSVDFIDGLTKTKVFDNDL